MTIFLAVDPGVSTGVAYCQFTNDEPLKVLEQHTVHDGVYGWLDFWRTRVQPELVVSENFKINGIPGTPGDSLQIEGAIIALHKGTTVWQTPAQKESIYPGHTEVERFHWLKDRGFTGTPHELDAASHALIRMRSIKHRPTLRKYFSVQDR